MHPANLRDRPTDDWRLVGISRVSEACPDPAFGRNVQKPVHFSMDANEGPQENAPSSTDLSLGATIPPHRRCLSEVLRRRLIRFDGRETFFETSFGARASSDVGGVEVMRRDLVDRCSIRPRSAHLKNFCPRKMEASSEAFDTNWD